LAKTSVAASLAKPNAQNSVASSVDGMELDQLEQQLDAWENQIYSPATLPDGDESIWQPVSNISRGFGVSSSGELPSLHLPAELDSFQLGTTTLLLSELGPND